MAGDETVLLHLLAHEGAAGGIKGGGNNHGIVEGEAVAFGDPVVFRGWVERDE